MEKLLALDIGRTVQNTVDRSVDIGIKLLMFLVIVGVGWAAASLLGRFTDRALDRMRFNAAAVRSGLSRWTGRYLASELVARLGYYAVLLFALQLGFSVFGPNPVSELIAGIVRWLPKAFVACVIVVVAASIARAVQDVIGSALGRLPYGPLLARCAQVVISALGVIAALNQIGVATTVTEPVLITALATVGGILVVGLGGGLVQPMRHRWERMLSRAETETTQVATHLHERNAGPAGAFGQPAYQARLAPAAQDQHRSGTPAHTSAPTPATATATAVPTTAVPTTAVPTTAATAAPAADHAGGVRPPGSVG